MVRNASSPWHDMALFAAAPRRCTVPLLTFLIAIALWWGLVGSAHAASAPLSVTPGAETSEGNALVHLQNDMLVLRAQLKLMISSYPDLSTIVPFVVRRVTKDSNQGFIWDLIIRVKPATTRVSARSADRRPKTCTKPYIYCVRDCRSCRTQGF